MRGIWQRPPWLWIFPCRIISKRTYGDVMVWVDYGTPKTQTVTIQAVQKKYGTKIDRKAVSRHLKLLSDLGFHVRKGKDGYYFGEAI